MLVDLRDAATNKIVYGNENSDNVTTKSYSTSNFKFYTNSSKVVYSTCWNKKR